MAAVHRWVDDADNRVGFSMDVEAAASYADETFTIGSPPFGSQIELTWLGDGTALADIDRDFYSFYGRLAEEAQFISRAVGEDALRYEVLVGTQQHGHRVTFVITGARARAVVKSYLSLRRPDAKRP